VIIFTFGFWAVAGLIPPPSPHDSAEQIARFYAENATRIRTGLVISCIGAAMAYPWAAVIAVQMRRIEGRWNPLALTELGSGLALGLIFMYPMVLMSVAAYRPAEIDPHITQVVNDMAWIGLIWVGPPTGIQALAIAIATLRDKRETPVFPRWVGYFNIWCALLFIPGLACIYVKTGPLAWNGVISFWIVLTAFTIWLFVMTVVLLRAITAQEQEALVLVEQSG
jgi:hypothetical protein